MYRSSRSFFVGGNSYRKNNYSRGKLVYGKKTFVSNNYRKLSYGFKKRNLKFLGNKGIKDDVIRFDRGICDEEVHASYLNMPRLGQGAGCRETDKVRVTSINMNGFFRVYGEETPRVIGQPMQSDAPGERASDVHSDDGKQPVSDAIAGLFIILDRNPDSTKVPNFEDVFGLATGDFDSKMDRLVRIEQLSRFKVLLRHKMIVRVVDDLWTLSRYLKYTGKNVVNTTFRDTGTERLGNYVNTKKNALIVYVIWEGDGGRKLYCNVNTRMMYYH